MAEDFYNTLGISREASQDDIKKAYRGLSKKYHPDLNPNNKESEEKFKKINEAYSTLSDPAKKQQYDRGGSNNLRGFNCFENVKTVSGTGLEMSNTLNNTLAKERELIWNAKMNELALSEKR